MYSDHLQMTYCECRYFHMYMYIHELSKIGKYAQIYIRNFGIIASIQHNNSHFHDVHIFRRYLRNVNNAEICTAQKYLH